MGAISNSLVAGLTPAAVAGTIPNVGGALVAIILFSIGIGIFRRFISGAGKAKAKI